jgi:hypothetical protein
MKSTATNMLRLTAALALTLALTAAARAQQPSPSPQKADAATQSPAPQNGDDDSPYTITSSVEIGYRGLSVIGDVNKYQSDLNYKAGPRLFDSSFLFESKQGGLFDKLLVTTTGWGSDPNGHMRISAENSDLFRFDGTYRRFKYFRSLNNIANPNYAPPSRQMDPAAGQHTYDNRQAVGDFDLTILPKNERLSFTVGYSPASLSGPFYTTYRGGGGDEFPIFAEADSRSHDFRLGADWKLGPVEFSFMQGFRRYTDDSFISNNYLNVGNNPTATNFSLTSIDRRNPTDGSVNYTRLSGHTLLARKLDITGRIIYSDSTAEYTFTDTLTGRNFNSRWDRNRPPYNPAIYDPSATNPTILTLGLWDYQGETKRPNTLADFGVTYFATDRLRLSNSFRVETFQINGGALYNGRFEITRATNNTALAPLVTTAYSHEVTKYRKIQNTVEGNFDFNPRYSVRFGYRYLDRWLEEFVGGHNLAQLYAPLWTAAELEARHIEEEYRTNAFFGGVRARPVKNWSLSFDLERATSNGVFTRTGYYDYWNVRARTRYTVNRNLKFNLGFLSRDNATPDEISHHGLAVSYADFAARFKSRAFTSSAEWTVNSRLSFSGAYNYNRQESDTVTKYSFNNFCPPGVTGNSCITGRSQYFMRNHYVNVDVVARPFNRLTFYAAYRINKDTGQGGRLSDPTGERVLVTSYPFSYQSPEARVSWRFNRMADLNLGYQYFNYSESPLASGNFYPIRPQNYHAHLPYASLRFYFGGGER